MTILAFINKNDILQLWSYHTAEFKVFVNNKEYDLKNRLRNISIFNRFETHLYPIFRVELILEPEVYYAIMNNKSTAQFHVRLQKYYRKFGEEKKSLYRDVINDKFNLILDDSDYDTDKTLREERDSNDYKYRSISTYNQLQYVDNVIELFLYKKDYNEKMNVIVNEVLRNATVTNAIQYIASKAGIKDILMTIPDNSKVYSELVIPPLKAKEAIRWVDTYYGLYKTGMLFYVDPINSTTYILKYNGDCTAYRRKEIKDINIMIPEKTSKHAAQLCGLKRYNVDDAYYIICSNSNIKIRNETISLNMTDGLDIVNIDSYSGDVAKLISKGQTTDSRTIKVIEDQTENPWYGNIYTSLSGAKSTVVEVSLSYHDINDISPNRRCKLLFENTELARKYNANYKITQVNNVFARDGEDFKLDTTVRLVKL